MTFILRFCGALAVTALGAANAFAHPGHGAAVGHTHLFDGLGPLLIALAIAVWAVRLAPRKLPAVVPVAVLRSRRWVHGG